MYFLQKTTKLKFLRVAKIVSDRKESREKLTFSVTFTFSVTYIYYFGNLTFWDWSSPLLKWFPLWANHPLFNQNFWSALFLQDGCTLWCTLWLCYKHRPVFAEKNFFTKIQMKISKQFSRNNMKLLRNKFDVYYLLDDRR